MSATLTEHRRTRSHYIACVRHKEIHYALDIGHDASHSLGHEIGVELTVAHYSSRELAMYLLTALIQSEKFLLDKRLSLLDYEKRVA